MVEKREYEELAPGYYKDELTYKYVDFLSRGTYNLDKPEQGIIPHISVYSKNIPAAFELAMLACWDYGARIGTHYDKKEDTPKSKEGTISLKITNPFNEPRISLPGFPGGPYELEAYRQEVVNGIHDHWIDPKAGKWTYTYHDRLTNWNPFENEEELRRGGRRFLERGINQIDEVIIELNKDITSRAAQMITWYPTADPRTSKDRPCLQRLWFRVSEDKNNELILNLNSHWRSRDLAKAWFMNVYAITDLQRDIAEKLSKKIKRPVKVGSYLDISDSLHVYGDYFNEIKSEFEKMRIYPIEGDKEKGTKERVWTSDHPAFVFMTEEARENLAKDPDYYAKGDAGKK